MPRLSTMVCCAEGLFFLTVAKCQVVFMSYSHWRFRRAYFHCETLKQEIPEAQDKIRCIQKSVRWLVRCLPWKSVCLDQAMAVQRMLFRRGFPVTLYLGMRKNEQQQWVAHAWVRCGTEWVIGYDSNIKHTVVGVYAWIPRA